MTPAAITGKPIDHTAVDLVHVRLRARCVTRIERTSVAWIPRKLPRIDEMEFRWLNNLKRKRRKVSAPHPDLRAHRMLRERL